MDSESLLRNGDLDAEPGICMLTYMRTTLIIDDHVVIEAKRQALEAGLSLSELTTMALRETLRKRSPQTQPSPFSMPTYGSGVKRHSSPGEITDLRDEGR
jgi:hypothetical protein